MDVFVYGVPTSVTAKQARTFISAPFAEHGIHVYHCEVLHGKPFAILTILDPSAGQRFLNKYGVPTNAPRHVHPQKYLVWQGRKLRCSISRNKPDPYNTKALIYDAQVRTNPVPPQAVMQNHGGTQIREYDIGLLQCGTWDYANQQLVFTAHHTCNYSGSITFGKREAILVLRSPTHDQIRLDIEYWNCEHVITGTNDDPTVTFCLRYAPKMYKIAAEIDLSALLTSLMLGAEAGQKKKTSKERTLGIDVQHERIAGVCFVYRLTLSDARKLGAVRSLLQGSAQSLSTISLRTNIVYPYEKLERSFTVLENELTDTGRHGKLPFRVLYQATRLARNGYLAPHTVIGLLPKISDLVASEGQDAVTYALSRLCTSTPIPGPDVESHFFEIKWLETELNRLVGSYDHTVTDNPFEISKRFSHIILVHKVVITPTGMILCGPEPEPTNRVLRRYADHTDNFCRVVFLDEDGSNVRYDPRASQYKVFHERFKGILDSTILVAGRGFSFLGFSHSSLRSQSCWFMAPLIRNDGLTFAPQILKELGDFSAIRTPAKCAARIGQSFTDTNSTVSISPHGVGELPVIERNGRDFSDGCGTISQELLRKIWQVYGTKRLLKPTVLQIRFQGAKGLVSLDSRLWGERLMLRSNMRKFETKATWDVEICGAGFRPLPMILNRQFIKIMEDLGIGQDVFINLQAIAINDLRCMTENAPNTAAFLEGVSEVKALRISSLISLLGEAGLDYHADAFLYSVVELAVVTKLQELKYRGRIPVEHGVTLYGIVDETGFLCEGEIFVIMERGPEGGKQCIVKDRVVITRSPAMHPGDIQLVNAVNVPDSSPLKQLSNVVVFSQHGARDLPSQLSGGDLDGDLYNIIWDNRLIPAVTYPAADYPRVKPVELDRAVTAKDMSDFFVTFMETDVLGMISNIHMQLADMRESGTLDPDCIKLAGMASTAVDFSKTGIAVNMKDCPKYPRYRPDFMNPSPRIIVSESGHLEFDEEDNVDDEAFEELNDERRPMRYYTSDKALGHLFRAIDERQFVVDMQQQHRNRLMQPAAASLMLKVRRYVLHWARQWGILFEHQMELARDIRLNYEDNMLDTLYRHAPVPHMPLTESEVFSGIILGRKAGAQGKPLREHSKAMRERFESVAEYTILRITKGDEAIQEAIQEAEYLDELFDDREIESLPRAIACLVVGVDEKGMTDPRVGELKSFQYLAASVCLRELQRYRITTFGRFGPLPRFDSV